MTLVPRPRTVPSKKISNSLPGLTAVRSDAKSFLLSPPIVFYWPVCQNHIAQRTPLPYVTVKRKSTLCETDVVQLRTAVFFLDLVLETRCQRHSLLITTRKMKTRLETHRKGTLLPFTCGVCRSLVFTVWGFPWEALPSDGFVLYVPLIVCTHLNCASLSLSVRLFLVSRPIICITQTPYPMRQGATITPVPPFTRVCWTYHSWFFHGTNVVRGLFRLAGQLSSSPVYLAARCSVSQSPDEYRPILIPLGDDFWIMCLVQRHWFVSGYTHLRHSTEPFFFFELHTFST